jgi:hypothetical protein
MSDRGTLRSPETTVQKVIARHQIINAGSPLLADYAIQLIQTAVTKRFISEPVESLEDPKIPA